MILDPNYFKSWKQINQQWQERGFSWGSLPDEKEIEHQYGLIDLYRMDAALFQRIQTATQRIGAVFEKAVRFLQQSPSLYEMLHLPKNTWDVVQLPSKRFSQIARMDLIVQGTDIRIIELNCDTPTGLVESAIGNEVVCQQFGESSPNSLESSLRQAFYDIQEEYGITSTDTVYFTSYGWHIEDRQTTEFIRKHSGLANIAYLPIEELRVNQKGVYTSDGKLIHYLYRLYPLEYFSRDKGKNGEPIGDWLLDHVANGRVHFINPPSAFLGQAKTTMAVIWMLHELKYPLFTEDEHSTIEQHFLPTYVTAERFKGVAYVQKPIWGREGGGVSIVNADNTIIEEDRTPYYAEQPKIYQAYREMPTVSVRTWEGDYTGSLLVGSFLVGGNPSGIFLRVGGKITGNLSMFLPVVAQ